MREGTNSCQIDETIAEDCYRGNVNDETIADGGNIWVRVMK